ncbi:MAG: DUF6809 family protein [Faecalispora sporosphaeroides]|uniref:DUF6809 family protein n=1 Tax=Faecalispora sporosphaeroides TaxID=1549 RepID=UPI003993A6A5
MDYKKDDFITRLYHGEIVPIEQMVQSDTKYQAIFEKQLEASTLLLQSFSHEQEKLLVEYQNCLQQTNAYLQEKAFSYGLKFGVSFFLEAIKL